jgi:hypothetical protein
LRRSIRLSSAIFETEPGSPIPIKTNPDACSCNDTKPDSDDESCAEREDDVTAFLRDSDTDSITSFNHPVAHQWYGGLLRIQCAEPR